MYVYVHSANLFAIDFQRSMALRLAQEKCVESFYKSFINIMLFNDHFTCVTF